MSGWDRSIGVMIAMSQMMVSTPTAMSASINHVKAAPGRPVRSHQNAPIPITVANPQQYAAAQHQR